MAQSPQSQLNSVASNLTLVKLALETNFTQMTIAQKNTVLQFLAEISLTTSDIFEQLGYDSFTLTDWQNNKLKELVDGE